MLHVRPVPQSVTHIPLKYFILAQPYKLNPDVESFFLQIPSLDWKWCLFTCFTLLSFCCSSFESVVASQLVRLLDLLRFTSSLPGFSIFRQFFFCFPPSFLPFFFSKALYYVSSSSSPSVSCVLTDLIPRPCF